MVDLKIITSKVSSNVLNMQFMKRQQEKCKKELNKQLLETNSPALRIHPVVQTINDKPTCSIESAFNEERFSVLETLRFGRFSYNGQNPEIENLMIYHQNKLLDNEIEENYIEESDNSELDDTTVNSNSFQPLLNEVCKKKFVEAKDLLPPLNPLYVFKKKLNSKKRNINAAFRNKNINEENIQSKKNRK